MDNQKKSNQFNLEDYTLRTRDGQVFDVPVAGCLGLLALGDVGLIAWRQKRKAEQAKANNQKHD